MKTIAEVRDIVSEVKYRDWRFLVEVEQFPGFATAPACLVIEFDEPCNVTGAPAVQRSRKWRLSPHMTKGEIVQTALLAVRTALEHEMREQFTWRGKPIFGPHFDIECLHELCVANATEVRA